MGPPRLHLLRDIAAHRTGGDATPSVRADRVAPRVGPPLRCETGWDRLQALEPPSHPGVAYKWTPLEALGSPARFVVFNYRANSPHVSSYVRDTPSPILSSLSDRNEG